MYGAGLMKIRYLSEKPFYSFFLPLIVEVECGQHYDPANPQHVKWLKQRVHAIYVSCGRTIALFDENIPVGFLLLAHDKGLEKTPCFGKKGTIVMFGLFEQYRAQSLGKKLLDAAVEYLKKNGAECLYVDTYANNPGAIRYYVKNGFLPVAYHPSENGLNDKGQVYLCKELT
jgi:ribosomal protein S18 acetylase RimI-like enzyme